MAPSMAISNKYENIWTWFRRSNPPLGQSNEGRLIGCRVAVTRQYIYWLYRRSLMGDCLEPAPDKIHGCDWLGWLLSCKLCRQGIQHQAHMQSKFICEVNYGCDCARLICSTFFFVAYTSNPQSWQKWSLILFMKTHSQSIMQTEHCETRTLLFASSFSLMMWIGSITPPPPQKKSLILTSLPASPSSLALALSVSLAGFPLFFCLAVAEQREQKTERRQ